MSRFRAVFESEREGGGAGIGADGLGGEAKGRQEGTAPSGNIERGEVRRGERRCFIDFGIPDTLLPLSRR